ncbi:MAG: transglutaminaseTgpA domain-containing protein [Anaerolineae bacterium]
MHTALVWLIRRVGVKTILVLTCLLVALASVALGLVDSIRGLDSWLLLPVVAAGLLMGWWLARSPLPGWMAAIVALVLGFEAIFVRVARLAEPLATLLWALVDGLVGLFVFLVWGAGWPEHLPDATLILVAWRELWADIGIVLVRLWNWLVGWVLGQPGTDLVAVALVWSLVLGGTVTWAGWWVRRRHQALAGMVPAGVLLGSSLFFFRGNPAFAVPFLAATLLLIVLVGQDAREQRWSTTGVDYPSDVSAEVKLIGAGLSLVLVTTATLVPSISWRQVFDWAGRLVEGQQPRSGQVEAGLRGVAEETLKPQTVLDEDRVRAPGLPRHHLPGSGPELSRQVVMLVYVSEDQAAGDESSPGAPDPISGQVAPRYYWRSLTYDRYTGRGWMTSGTGTFEYRAGDLAIYRTPEPGGAYAQDEVIPPGRKKVHVEVRAVSSLGELIHTAGDLLTVDRDYYVAWRSFGDAFGATLRSPEGASTAATAPPSAPSGPPAPADQAAVATAVSVPTASGGQPAQTPPIVYRTDSLVPAVGEAQLRAAPSDYPDWIKQRYLALPDTVPSRVLALARDLTATEPTPYDRARAIEAYLRTLPYSLDLPPTQFEKDVVDYFLFDLKRGYCDYYATSMVVLARAAGLPARLAVGYFTGTYDEANHRYIVTEADAHAWVEIYFPGYGWIEFEPTAGIPSIERPADLAPAVPPELEGLEVLDVSPARLGPGWWLALLVVGLLSLGGLSRSVIDSWRLHRMPPETAVAVLYARLHSYGRRLAVPVRPGTTPYEFLASFTQRIAGVAHRRAWRAVLSPTTQQVRWLIDLYVRTCYAPQSPDISDQRRAIQTWRHLHGRLWLAWLSHIWKTGLRLISPPVRSARHVEHPLED